MEGDQGVFLLLSDSHSWWSLDVQESQGGRMGIWLVAPVLGAGSFVFLCRMQLQAVADDGKEEDVIQVKPGLPLCFV